MRCEGKQRLLGCKGLSQSHRGHTEPRAGRVGLGCASFPCPACAGVATQGYNKNYGINTKHISICQCMCIETLDALNVDLE